MAESELGGEAYKGDETTSGKVDTLSALRLTTQIFRPNKSTSRLVHLFAFGAQEFSDVGSLCTGEMAGKVGSSLYTMNQAPILESVLVKTTLGIGRPTWGKSVIPRAARSICTTRRYIDLARPYGGLTKKGRFSKDYLSDVVGLGRAYFSPAFSLTKDTHGTDI
jgi:hypothetical protein